jgi:uncharacterized protein with PIN domain
VNTAYIRFYEELNDFLPPPRRKVLYSIGFKGSPSVKSLIESEGIPHTEVDMVLVNGGPVTFSDKVRDGDHISVYPVFESLDISAINLTRVKPLREPKFVLDVHLGKLTRYLRMLGLDTLYNTGYQDRELADISFAENRCLLTRDRKLLMRTKIQRGLWIRSDIALEQAAEVIRRLDLKNSIRLFRRCTLCNGTLKVIDQNEALVAFPGYNFLHGTSFFRCGQCQHIYWNGSHCKMYEERIMKSLFGII